MSNPWNDILAADASMFTDPLLMPGVESITYEPAEGEAVAITAQVFRDVPVDTDLGVSFKIRIVVSRADVPTVNTSMDRVTLAKEIGKEPIEFAVSQIVNQDAGAFELQLE
jgi:hypothetical protein